MIINNKNGKLRFNVKVIPRSAKSYVAGIEAEAIKIKLNAPPVDGEANKALISFLSEIIGIPKQNINIIYGTQNRHKTIEVTGLNEELLRERFAPYIKP